MPSATATLDKAPTAEPVEPAERPPVPAAEALEALEAVPARAVAAVAVLAAVAAVARGRASKALEPIRPASRASKHGQVLHDISPREVKTQSPRKNAGEVAGDVVAVYFAAVSLDSLLAAEFLWPSFGPDTPLGSLRNWR